MISRTRRLDMTSGPLLSQMFFFALPIMAMNILQLLFNAADMVVVGRFSGSQSLAAVGATGSLISLLVNLFMGLSVGTSVVVARDYGAHSIEGIRRSVHTSIAISIVGGIIVTAAGLVFCKPMLRWMGTPNDIIELSTLYMRIYFIGMPASMIYNFGAAILRATGDSKRPMYFLAVSGGVNVVFNLLFVISFQLGVAGVAWATVISQYLSLVLIMSSLLKNPGPLRFSFERLKIDRDKLVQIIRIGLPAGLQSSLFSISNVLIQSAINSFGSTMVAANAAAGNVESFLGTTMNAYYNAAITFTGQNMGAEEYDRIDTIAKVSAFFIVVTSIILGAVILLVGRPLLGIYTSNPEVVDLGMLRMKIMMTTYVTCGTMSVFPGMSRAMGFSVLPMLCTLVGNCLMRILWLITIFKWYPTVFVLYLCYPVSWTIAGAGQVATFFYARAKIRVSSIGAGLSSQPALGD